MTTGTVATNVCAMCTCVMSIKVKTANGYVCPQCYNNKVMRNG